MISVCYLFGLRRSLSSGLGVETAAISAYDLHLRMTSLPIGACNDVTIFENINHRTALEVNDRAVGLRLPPTLILDSDDPRACWSNLSRTQQVPENGIVAYPYTQLPQ